MSVTALRVCDTSQYSRKSPEYRLGVAQLKKWHERCRCKLLGVTFRTLKLLANHGPSRIHGRDE